MRGHYIAMSGSEMYEINFDPVEVQVGMVSELVWVMRDDSRCVVSAYLERLCYPIAYGILGEVLRAFSKAGNIGIIDGWVYAIVKGGFLLETRRI